MRFKASMIAMMVAGVLASATGSSFAQTPMTPKDGSGEHGVGSGSDPKAMQGGAMQGGAMAPAADAGAAQPMMMKKPMHRKMMHKRMSKKMMMKKKMSKSM